MKKALGYLVIILVPLVLILTSVRLLLTDQYVTIEYHLPGFPDDQYGLTQEQRLEYAPLAMDYLLNDEGISFLGDQRFPDGTPLYNERELSHMADVKALTQVILKVWLLATALLVAIAAAAWRFKWWDEFRVWLGRGGKVTVILILVLLVFIAVSFDALFVEFHHIFFQGDSWLFLYTDTLIRLFPMRFWQDVFIALALFSLLGGAALWRFAPPRPAKKRVQQRKKK